jgi:CHASE3 domain sensor protein
MAFSPVQKLSIGTGVSLIALSLAGLVGYTSLTQLIGGQQDVASTNRNIARIDRVIARTLDSENAERGFVYTGDSSYLEPLDAAQSDVEFALDSLRVATEDNPMQRLALDSLAPRLSDRFLEIRAAVTAQRRFGRDSARALVRRERPVRANAGVGSLTNRMRDEELRVLGDRTRTVNARGQTVGRVILLSVFLSLVLALVALQPLRPGVAERLQQRLAQVRRVSRPARAIDLDDEVVRATDKRRVG